MKKRLLLKLMKFSLYGLMLQTMFVGMLMASGANAQRKQLSVKNVFVNVHLNEASLLEVFGAIESNTDFVFNYDDHIIKNNKSKISVVGKKTVADILVKVSEVAGVKFKQVNNNINVEKLRNKSDEVGNLEIVLQSQTVTGNVISDEDGQPLIGVSIVIKGTSQGTVTDIDGKYSVEVPSGESVLVFSFVGYYTEEVQVGNRSVINLTMNSDISTLSEVVVVGYGTARKSDITGSVVSVDTEEMLKRTPTNILEGLKGQAAGVMVTAQDGAPDANSAVRIRGVATITGTAKPLYVVDGVQVGDNANFINPGDVESIEILKDASATAIYGAAGANGVIMITTKHGKAGTTRINFSADYGIQTLARTLDVGDVDQYAKNIRAARANDGGSLSNQIFAEQYDGQRKNIDWQKEMTRVSLRQQYNLSASGGTEKTQSSLSLSYLNNDGIVINTNYKRLTGRVNVVSKVADFIEIGSDLSFVHTESHGSNAGLGNNGNLSSVRDWAFMAPTMDYIIPDGYPGAGTIMSPNVVNPDGTYGAPMQGNLGSHDANLGNNIYAEQMENTGITKNNRVLFSAYANVKLFKGLTFKSIASYNFSADNWYNFWGNKKRYFPDGTEVELYNYDSKYYLGINNSNYNKAAIESYLTYNWANDSHNLTLMAGNTVIKGFGNWSNVSGNDFLGDNVRAINQTKDPAARTGDGGYTLQSRGLSYFGRLQYVLMDRYILTSTFRRDGSSHFGADNRWGTFPSAALAWRISEEGFMKSIPTINNLKLRLGWGQTGNSGGPTDKSVTALTSEKIQYFYYGQNGEAGMSTSRQLATGYAPTLTDPRLKWETNEQSNIGLDLGLFSGSLNITADYFVRTSKDLLLYQSIRPSSGYIEVYTNFGEIQNKGFEFSLDYEKQISRDWNIGAILTGSTLKNKIVELSTDVFRENTGSTNDGSNVGAVGAPSGTHWNGHSLSREGYAVGSFWGYMVEGIYQSQDEIDAANAAAIAAGHTGGYNNASTTVPGDFKYKDLNGDGFLSEEDMTILGNGFPKLNYGLTLKSSYKNWDFLIYSYGVLGQDIYSYSAMTLSNMFASDNGTTPNVLQEVANSAWTEENHSTTTPRLSILDLNYNMRGSDAWVKKGDFLKIGTLQIGYTLSKELLSPLRIESARIYTSVQNLATFSSYNKYGDPETGQGSVLYTGLDTGRYPYPRTYSIGLNIQF